MPKGTTQPRGQLYAAVINTHTGEIVKRSLTNWHQPSIKLTDSQIVLHWISNDNKPLKQYVRTRVIEIKRFTSNQDWFYVNTDNIIADIGTRKGATLKDVSRTSTWINGFDWMHLDHSQFPLKSAENLKLSDSEITEVNKEVQIFHINNKEFKRDQHTQGTSSTQTTEAFQQSSEFLPTLSNSATSQGRSLHPNQFS